MILSGPACEQSFDRKRPSAFCGRSFCCSGGNSEISRIPIAKRKENRYTELIMCVLRGRDMEKKNLVIAGAGGCAREALQWAKDVNRVQERWNIKGLLCDYPDPLKGKKCDVPVLGTIDGYEIGEDDEFVVGVGDGAGRKLVTDRLKARGARLVNLIHPTAVIADSCTLGEGLIIYPFALISDNARIGDGCQTARWRLCAMPASSSAAIGRTVTPSRATSASKHFLKRSAAIISVGLFC